MISSLADRQAASPLRTTVCVIGSGAAGTAVALALGESGIDVLLLEAGGAGASKDEPLLGNLTEAPGHDPLERVRQRRLGGTTAQWGGRCLPFNEVDLQNRDWVPGSGWPIDLQVLMPWYRRAAALLQLGDFEWTASEALPDAVPLFPNGSGALTDDQLWRWSPPVRFWPTFRRQLASSRRVTVLQQAPVLRLEQDEPGGPVVAAVVGGPGRSEVRVIARTYVVAAGGIETARLLLVSDAHSTGGIGNSGDALGRNYMIHPLAEVAQVHLSPGLDVRGVADFARDRKGVWVRRMLRLSDAAQRQHQLRNAAFALWYPDPRDPDHGNGLLSSFALIRRALTRTGDFKATGVHRRYAQIGSTQKHLANVARDLPDIGRFSTHWVRNRWLGRRTVPSFTSLQADGIYRLRFDAEQSPERQNRVFLARDRDDLGVRRAAVRHSVGRDDRESIVRSLHLLAVEIERSGRGRVSLPPDALIHDGLVFGDGTHQMGTARMSATPRTGVVDSNCRAHDCRNLRLAGSAVFPTGGMAGPTLTIVALGLRLAADIARECGTTPHMDHA